MSREACVFDFKRSDYKNCEIGNVTIDDSCIEIGEYSFDDCIIDTITIESESKSVKITGGKLEKLDAEKRSSMAWKSIRPQ